MVLFEAQMEAILVCLKRDLCRVTSLRILCELRLEKEDLHNVVEHALHPPRKTKAEKKAEALAAQSGRRHVAPEPPLPTMEQMRRQPLAKDSSGLMYWFLDYHTTTGKHSCSGQQKLGL